MAHVRKRSGKVLSFTITASLGYDAENRQIRKYTTFTPPDGVTPGKAEKLAREYAILWEEQIRGYVSLDENKTLAELADCYLDFDTSIKNNNPQSLENNGLAGF